MDPFSLDENGNVSFFNDVPCSTPKRKGKSKYVCKECGKVYVVKHYFEKHVSAHNQKDVSANTSANIHLDATDLSVNQLLTTTSLPQAAPNTCFKVPPPKKRKVSVKKTKKTTLVCTYCLKHYVCSRSYQSHIRTHIMQDAARRFPDCDDILKNIGELSTSALTEVANCVSCGQSGLKFKGLVGHVIGSPENFHDFSTAVCKILLTSIADKKTLLPSPLMTTLFDKMEEILSNNDKCTDLLAVLQVSEFCENIQAQFLLEFLMNFTTAIFRYISKTYQAHFGVRSKTIPELDLEDKQVIYYIGGSIMRGYLKMARRHKDNSKWQNVVDVIKNSVLCDKPEGEIEAQWTADVDRGGLLYITTPMQEFLKKVTMVVYLSEKRDGSIDYEEVIAKVSTCDICVVWDNIVCDRLPEEVSLNLMNDIIMCFCKTCGRGIAKRRLNFLRQKPLISMATRVGVASRKK